MKNSPLQTPAQVPTLRIHEPYNEFIARSSDRRDAALFRDRCVGREETGIETRQPTGPDG